MIWVCTCSRLLRVLQASKRCLRNVNGGGLDKDDEKCDMDNISLVSRGLLSSSDYYLYLLCGWMRHKSVEIYSNIETNSARERPETRRLRGRAQLE